MLQKMIEQTQKEFAEDTKYLTAWGLVNKLANVLYSVWMVCIFAMAFMIISAHAYYSDNFNYQLVALVFTLFTGALMSVWIGLMIFIGTWGLIRDRKKPLQNGLIPVDLS